MTERDGLHGVSPPCKTRGGICEAWLARREHVDYVAFHSFSECVRHLDYTATVTNRIASAQ
jgi:hypothetical protein